MNYCKEDLKDVLYNLKREMEKVAKYMAQYKEEDENFSLRVQSKALELKGGAKMVQDWIDGIKEEM